MNEPPHLGRGATCDVKVNSTKFRSPFTAKRQRCTQFLFQFISERFNQLLSIWEVGGTRTCQPSGRHSRQCDVGRVRIILIYSFVGLIIWILLLFKWVAFIHYTMKSFAYFVIWPLSHLTQPLKQFLWKIIPAESIGVIYLSLTWGCALQNEWRWITRWVTGVKSCPQRRFTTPPSFVHSSPLSPGYLLGGCNENVS